MLLGIVKYQNFLIGKKSILVLLKDYMDCLENELDWLKTQRTIQKEKGWILDYNKIHQMEAYIYEENEKYLGIINDNFPLIRKLTSIIKEHKIAIGITVFLFIVSPIFAGIIVSIPSSDWLSKDNDWIGFWGNYIGGIIGAIIGGFVAYKIAENGFKGQRELDKQSKIAELKINYLTNFNTNILTLQQRILINREYIFLTYENIKKVYYSQKGNETITFESISDEIIRSQQLIEKNCMELYNLLEEYQRMHEVSKFLVSKHQSIIQIAHQNILAVLRETSRFKALFALCKEEWFSQRKTINFDNNNIEMAKFNDLCKDIDYSLYTIVVYLRNEISTELSLPQFSIEDKEAYISQRFN